MNRELNAQEIIHIKNTAEQLYEEPRRQFYYSKAQELVVHPARKRTLKRAKFVVQ